MLSCMMCCTVPSFHACAVLTSRAVPCRCHAMPVPAGLLADGGSSSSGSDSSSSCSSSGSSRLLSLRWLLWPDIPDTSRALVAAQCPRIGINPACLPLNPSRPPKPSRSRPGPLSSTVAWLQPGRGCSVTRSPPAPPP